MKITRTRYEKSRAFYRFARANYNRLPPNKKTSVALITPLLVLILITLFIKGCAAIVSGTAKPAIEAMVIRQGNTLKIPENSPLRKQLIANKVETSSLPHTVSIPATIDADPLLTVNILPPLSGRLTQFFVRFGDHVKKNQVLAEISSPGLDQAYSDIDKAHSVLILTNEALKRARKVNHVGGNSKKDIELALSNYEQAQAEFKRAQTTIKTLGRNKSNRLTIKAPIEGRITAINYGKGSYINDPAATLLTISNIETVLVTANIPENLIEKTVANLPVDIYLTAYPNEVWHGKISFVNAFIEPDSRRNKTRIVLQNPNKKLQPNMFAIVKIAYPKPNQIIIPTSSVLMNDDTTSVFVEIAPWTFERRTVELGAEDGEKVRVLSGLNPGDRIVLSGGVLVND